MVNKGEAAERHGQIGRGNTILEASRSTMESGARKRFSPAFPGFPKLYGHLLPPPSIDTYASFHHCVQCPHSLVIKPAFYLGQWTLLFQLPQCTLLSWHHQMNDDREEKGQTMTQGAPYCKVKRRKLKEQKGQRVRRNGEQGFLLLRLSWVRTRFLLPPPGAVIPYPPYTGYPFAAEAQGAFEIFQRNRYKMGILENIAKHWRTCKVI